MGQPVGSFWMQLRPVLFLVLLFLLNLISSIVLAPLLRAIEKELGVTTARRDRYFFLVDYVMGDAGSFAIGFAVTALSFHWMACRLCFTTGLSNRRRRAGCQQSVSWVITYMMTLDELAGKIQAVW